MNYTYFVARSDAAASSILTWFRSPHPPPAEDPFAASIEGVGFSQELGRFAQLVMGGGSDLDLEDGEHRIATATDGRDVILKLPPILVRAIADSDLDRLHSLVPEWAEFPHFAVRDPDGLRTFTTGLHRLCRTATDAGGVYSHGWT